jgi:hypothetical protein
VLGPFPAQIDQTTRWNGWACPRFTKDVAEQIAVASCAQHSYVTPSHALLSVSADSYRCACGGGWDKILPEHAGSGPAFAAQHIANAQPAGQALAFDPDYIAWRWVGEVLELDSNPAVTDAYTERWEADADGFYHVGSWAWCWSEEDEVTLEALLDTFPNAYRHHGFEGVDVPWADGFIIITEDADEFTVGVYLDGGWLEARDPEASVLLADAASAIALVNFLTEEQPESTDWGAWAVQWISDAVADDRIEGLVRS